MFYIRKIQVGELAKKLGLLDVENMWDWDTALEAASWKTG
jgi:hypothetical protein